jgi:hypothetical protein
MLSPDMNDMYKTECSTMLRDALKTVEQIQAVRFVDCSFPSVPSEVRTLHARRITRAARALSLSLSLWAFACRTRARLLARRRGLSGVRPAPRHRRRPTTPHGTLLPCGHAQAPHIQLLRWESMQDSEWQLRWAPSWSVQVAVEGQQYLQFSLTLRLFDLRLSGRMALKMSTDLSAITMSFTQPPKLRLKTECTVSWGSVRAAPPAPALAVDRAPTSAAPLATTAPSVPTSPCLGQCAPTPMRALHSRDPRPPQVPLPLQTYIETVIQDEFQRACHAPATAAARTAAASLPAPRSSRVPQRAALAAESRRIAF